VSNNTLWVQEKGKCKKERKRFWENKNKRLYMMNIEVLIVNVYRSEKLRIISSKLIRVLEIMLNKYKSITENSSGFLKSA